MSYSTIEAAVLTRVRAFNGGATFTAANSEKNDWRMLGAPSVLSAVVSQVGSGREGFDLLGYGEQGKRQESHELGVAVYAQIGNASDAEALATLHTTVDALKVYLRRYPRLNNTSGVRQAFVIETTRPRLYARSTDATTATHWGQVIVVQVVEETALDMSVETPN